MLVSSLVKLLLLLMQPLAMLHLCVVPSLHFFRRHLRSSPLLRICSSSLHNMLCCVVRVAHTMRRIVPHARRGVVTTIHVR